MIVDTYKIYLITNTVNNKKYVGVTKQKLERRWSQHCANPTNSLLNKAIEKYGDENFDIEVLFYATDEQSMIDLEDYFIKLHDTQSPEGYNMKEGGLYGKFLPSTVNFMTELCRERWKNPTKKMLKSNENLRKMMEEKREPILGVDIVTKDIIRYNSIHEASRFNTSVKTCLSGNAIYGNKRVWYYDEGFSDEFYKGLAEIKLGGFGKYSKGRNSWNKSDRESRIKAMIKSAEHRAKPIIGISRFDGSVLEFDSINQAVNKGYTLGSLYQSLTGKCKHAYNYCWFFKSDGKTIDDYKQSALQRIGKFNNTNIKPFSAVNLTTGEILKFNCLDEVEKYGFDKKSVRQVLIGRRHSYKNHSWKFC